MTYEEQIAADVAAFVNTVRNHERLTQAIESAESNSRIHHRIALSDSPSTNTKHWHAYKSRQFADAAERLRAERDALST
jgi:hypothetical protein